MRLAPAIALVGTIACGERPPAPAMAPGASATSAPGPLEVVVADEPGVERPTRWTDQLWIRENPNEDIGVFAYARQKTVLRVADAAVGWLEPGARRRRRRGGRSRRGGAVRVGRQLAAPQGARVGRCARSRPRAAA